MSITLVVISDGRHDYIRQTIPSALDHLHGPITRKIIYDDTGDAIEREWLAAHFPEFVIAHHPGGKQGFGGAIRFMWRHLNAWDRNPYVFWLEQDFTFNRDVDLDAMAHVLEERPQVAQLVLRRQPWSAEERAAGGIIELRPDTYRDCHDGQRDWVEHTNFWSTNPHLFRRSLCDQPWPEDPHSEGRFGFELRKMYEGAVFGYWGARTDAPWVEHIGLERMGSGY